MRSISSNVSFTCVSLLIFCFDHLSIGVSRVLKSPTNENENMTTENLWDVAKAVLRGKFIAIQSYLKKQEKHRIDNLTLHLKQIDNLTLHLKQLEKEEQK